jgi:hypothetical protein
MDELTSQFLVMLEGRYGTEVSDSLKAYYQQYNVGLTVPDRADYVINVLGFEVDNDIPLSQFIQAAEICSIIAPEFPRLFMMSTSELN